MPRVDPAGKPILISGASSGIGAATARACAQAGMPVALMARRRDKLDAVAHDIERAGGRALVIAGDVSDPESCAAAVAQTVESFGSLYAVFANAGFGFEKSVLETTDDELAEIMGVNFWGTVHLVRPAAERMIELGGGHVIICSSCIGKFAVPWYSAYCASKAAQWHLGHALAGELMHHNIHATTVHPIGTKTEFFDEAKKRTPDKESVADNTPDFLMQSPDFVASRIVKAIRRPKLEVWTGAAGLGTRLTAALLTASPGLTHRMIKGVAKKKRGG